MKFEELSEQEYQQFEKNHKYCNFLNGVETIKLEDSLGWNVCYVGVKENNEVVCATPLVQMPIMRKFHYFYSPRGLLIDFSNVELLTYFTNEIKRFAKNKKAIYIVVDPYVLYKQRDINSELVEGGFDNSYVVDNLKKVGYSHQGFSVGYGKNMQYVRWMFAMDLVDKTEEGIWKDLHQQTRWSINKTLKYNMKVRELAFDELDLFCDIMQDTSERRNFENRDIDFYQKQYEAYGDKMKVLLAYLDVPAYLSSIKRELSIAESEQLQVKNELEKNANSKKFVKRLKVVDEAICIANKRYEEALELQAEHGDHISMAASMFVFFGSEVTYLTSGAYSKFKGFYASYALQWHVIQEALKQGYSKYNFYGISGEFDENNENYGVFKFKQGFGGQVEELIGDFVLPTRPTMYKLYKKLRG